MTRRGATTTDPAKDNTDIYSILGESGINLQDNKKALNFGSDVYRLDKSTNHSEWTSDSQMSHGCKEKTMSILGIWQWLGTGPDNIPCPFHNVFVWWWWSSIWMNEALGVLYMCCWLVCVLLYLVSYRNQWSIIGRSINQPMINDPYQKRMSHQRWQRSVWQTNLLPNTYDHYHTWKPLCAVSVVLYLYTW